MSRNNKLRPGVKRILDYIVNCPDIGTTSTDIQKALRISYYSAQNGIETLRKHGLVVGHKYRRFTRLFPSVEARDAGIAILVAQAVADYEITVVDTNAIIAQGLMSRTPLELAWAAQ